MKGTGVFATAEEVEMLKNMIGAPYLMVDGKPPSDPIEECHRLALRHGLPEITGFYGIKNDGEFTKA